MNPGCSTLHDPTRCKQNRAMLMKIILKELIFSNEIVLIKKEGFWDRQTPVLYLVPNSPQIKKITLKHGPCTNAKIRVAAEDGAPPLSLSSCQEPLP